MNELTYRVSLLKTSSINSIHLLTLLLFERHIIRLLKIEICNLLYYTKEQYLNYKTSSNSNECVERNSKCNLTIVDKSWRSRLKRFETTSKKCSSWNATYSTRQKKITKRKGNSSNNRVKQDRQRRRQCQEVVRQLSPHDRRAQKKRTRRQRDERAPKPENLLRSFAERV